MKTLARILDSTHLELNEPIPVAPGKRIEISFKADDEGDSKGGGDQQQFGGRASSKTASGPNRDRELAWRRAHEHVLQSFAGQWVVLEHEEIIAHGSDPSQVVEQARSQGIQIPYVFYVEEFRPDTVKMGLL